MVWQVSKLHCEVLRLDDRLRDLEVRLQLHGTQILEQEEKQEGDSDIKDYDNEGDSLLVEVVLAHKEEVDVIRLAHGLHEVHIVTLLL
jgi:hypothetical protein